MDSGEIPGESIVVSVPSSPGNVEGGIERQDPVTPTPIRKAWVDLVDKCLGTLLTIIQLLCAPLLALFLLVATKWKRVFILSCVAVSIDCLFLYIPIIDQENKCLGSDKRLTNIALVLRSITDIAFIFHILLLMANEMDEDPKWDPAKASWLYKKSIYIIVNFLAILPIPQVTEKLGSNGHCQWIFIVFLFFCFLFSVDLAWEPNLTGAHIPKLATVGIVVGFSRLGGSKHFLKQTIINVFLIFQYFLRIFQIFLSIKKVGDSVGKLVKGLFNFLLYIIASHVIAAFWYFFSIQRVISCWDHICRTLRGCKFIYDCGGRTSLNSTSINKLCQIDSPNATLFDFGMYSEILKSGTTGSTKFSTKFFYYFWWSLKNLSNFGTNLETSSYMWENCFAILISIIGLLLFLILIGNVQTYIQSETEKSVKIGELRRTRLNTKYKDIETWMLNHGLPDNMKTHMWKNIKENKVVELINKDVDIGFMHSCYIRDVFNFKSDPLIFICVKELKKISIFRYMDEQDLERFCYPSNWPKYATREKDSYITRAETELNTLYLIIDGTAEDAQTMRRHDRVGEEVLRWAILNYKKWSVHRDSLPISPVDIKCLTKIGAFTFTADELIDLCRILGVVHDISKNDDRIKDWLLRNGFPEDLKANIMNCLDQNKLLGAGKMNADDVDVDFLFGILPEYIKPSIKRHLGMRALKKVPMLRKLHEYALEIICNHLEPVVYMMNSYVVRAGKPLGFMIFILEGKVIITSSSEITEPSDENVIERGCYYGEQLLSWASPNNISSSDNPVISTRDVKCPTKVEALILKAEDLKSAASKCGSQWNFNNCMNSQQVVDVGKDRAANTAPTSTIEEEAIQLHQGHDMILEQLVLIRETIFRRLDDIRSGIRDHGTKLDDQGRRLDDQGRRLDDMAAFLATVSYTGLTGTSSTPSAL
uniref:cyclic nucleotide-gated ion channel 1-like n=1 Tax=Fragaria vesca subsp. vesca TaxID=101020 RepID=UPI0005C845B6|nr:PREDICTED: cyclic nucleotide-gated ion channel 1-like [Fragaria vesca subsp. vesca]